MTARRDGWRSWLPLGSATPMLLLLVLFPSALNVPQTNPSQTLEFAPVPPQDDEPPPPPDSGNISTVGLGNTVTGPTVGGDVPVSPEVPSSPTPSPPPVPPVPEAEGTRPSTKRCVGSPPRQTEDPMSPPCVAHFEGDNGGATAPGVTRDEVVILVYIQWLPASVASECAGEGCDTETFYDLGRPPDESPHDERDAYWPHVYRMWQTYFSDRFQLYGRKAHLWVHFGSTDDSPEGRIADVAAAAEHVKPFAVIADVDVNGEVYASEWARRGMAVFMNKTSTIEAVGFTADFFRRYPGQIWDYTPSVEELADNFGNFLCAQVVPHPVSFAGDGTNGQPRRLGLLRSDGPGEQNRSAYATLVRERLEGCGATIASEQSYESFGETADGTSSAMTQDRVAAAMRADGVTTIVYLSRGPSIPGFSHAVARQPGWRPEWIVQMDNVAAIKAYEDPTVFQHARNVTIFPRAASGSDRPCERAFLEADPRGSAYAETYYVCHSYNTARMLFTGIQVAGPRLSWESLDVGMHAIPEIPGGDPAVPACFYRTGDYTCVKDAQAQWWDPSGQTDRNTEPGCWRSMQGGKRYLAGDWPEQDVEAARDPASDGCNVQT